MDVLFSETITAASALAARQLADAGHVVHYCHTPADIGVGCAALQGRPCPLEAAPIDVAVTVRPIDRANAGATDDGIYCAIRRHVPVVVADTFPDAASLANAVETAVSDLPDLSAAATEEARRCAGDNATATVRRSHGGLRVAVRNAGDHPGRTAVRVAGVLRIRDPYARSIDITAR